jgi:hypothetical protein
VEDSMEQLGPRQHASSCGVRQMRTLISLIIPNFHGDMFCVASTKTRFGG